MESHNSVKFGDHRNYGSRYTFSLSHDLVRPSDQRVQ